MQTAIRNGARAATVVVFGMAALLCLGQAGARAAAYTWSGGGADGNWDTAGNWDSTPVSATDTALVFDTNTNGFASNNTIANPFQLSSMTYNSGLPVLSIAGSALALNGAREIYQNSSNSVTVGNTVSWGQSQWMHISGAGSGDLSLSTLAFSDQGYFRLRNTAAFNAAFDTVTLIGTRTAYMYNDMPVSTGKQITIGNVSFTSVGAAPEFGLFGVGRSEITGQLSPVAGAGASFRFDPATNGTVLLSNAGGAFSGTVDGSFRNSGGTIDLGGNTQQIRDLAYYGANAVNGTAAVRNLYLDWGTLNISVADGTGYTGNLIKRDVTNNDSWVTAACTHTGSTRLIASDITLQNSGSVSQSSIEFDVVPRNGEDSRLILSNTAANNADRISDTQSVTMSGGQLHLLGNASAATQEDMGPVTVSRQAAIQVGAAAGGVASLTGDSLTRANYGTLYIGGYSLGGAAAANVGQVKFDTAPAQTAGTPGTTSSPVVPWVTGYNYYNYGFADMLTYDAGTGFRPLAAGEYVLNDPASGGAANNRLASNTTTTWNLAGSDVAMKSLAFVPSANGTYTLGGTGGETLTVTDGVIVSGRSNQSPSNVISVSNLTFGPNSVTGYEGIVHS